MTQTQIKQIIIRFVIFQELFQISEATSLSKIIDDNPEVATNVNWQKALVLATNNSSVTMKLCGSFGVLEHELPTSAEYLAIVGEEDYIKSSELTKFLLEKYVKPEKSPEDKKETIH